MNREVANQCAAPCHPGAVVRIGGGLFTGFGGRSSLAVAYGTSDWLFGTLDVSSGHLAIASWSSPAYEIRKAFIEKLIFRQPRLLKGLQIAWLRILHKMPDAPE